MYIEKEFMEEINVEYDEPINQHMYIYVQYIMTKIHLLYSM